MQHPWDNSTIFYQQDKEGGIYPAFDSCSLRPLKIKQRGGRLPPRCFLFFHRRALSTSGKPALICTQKVGLFSNGIV